MFYFDESGDLGNLNNNSNTSFFTVAVYKEFSKQDTELVFNKIKKELNIGVKNHELKWYKLNNKKKKIFPVLFENFLNSRVYIIYCNKSEFDNLDMDTFKNMLSELISNFELFGNYKYEGEHLAKYLEQIRKSFKHKGKKVFFQNSRTKENPGIQIADLCAGYVGYLRERGMNINFKNIIKYK